jgi:hypothetical protein
MDGLEEFHRQALEVLMSPRLAEAFDLSREDGAVRQRYGLDRRYPNELGGKTLLDPFLLARRVIEAGARCVTLAITRWPFGQMLSGDFNWDWHKDIFSEARRTLPLLNLGLSALIQDLEKRSLPDDIAFVAWGKFGRTPKIKLTRPVHFRDVFATLYQRLKIDVTTPQFTDLAGRPQYLVGEHRPLPEFHSI